MKNHAHLAELDRLLQTANLAGVTALIIDDEADQAGLDTRPGTGNPSTTYRRIRAVRAALPRHTYLQYTATPQAPLLISLADMLSPEFAEVLQPGERYAGGQTFFVDRPNLVRAIPIADLQAQQAGPPESLLAALRVFFVGAAAHTLIRGKRGSARCSFTRREKLRPKATTHGGCLESSSAGAMFSLSRLAMQNGRTFSTNSESRTRTWPRRSRGFPRFDDLVRKMPVAVHRIVVTQVNSATGEEVDWNRGAYHILVGGEKMSRGYTVKGLTVTYMPRPPGMWMADTIQQRARFFGYKQRYLRFCRAYLPGALIGAYRWYVRHEENVRDQLDAYRGRACGNGSAHSSSKRRSGRRGKTYFRIRSIVSRRQRSGSSSRARTSVATWWMQTAFLLIGALQVNSGCRMSMSGTSLQERAAASDLGGASCRVLFPGFARRSRESGGAVPHR